MEWECTTIDMLWSRTKHSGSARQTEPICCCQWCR